MIYGVIALLFAQLVLVGLTGAAYLRLRQHADASGRDVLSWGVKIEAAMSKADSANAKVDAVETTHYSALKAKYEVLHTDYLELRRKFDDMEKRYEQLRLTIASNARQSRRERAAERTEEAAPAMPGQEPQHAAGDLEEAIRRGQAIPLFSPNGATPVSPARSTFGQPAY